MLARFFTTRVVLTTLVSAGIVVAAACSKDDDDDGGATVTPITAENKEDAKKAAASQTASIAASNKSGNSLTDPQARQQIRALWAQARAMRMMQDDPEIPDLGNLDICQFFTAGCEQSLNKAETDEDGTTCTTTSCTNGIANTCTSPAEKTMCKGVEYTFSQSTSTSLLTCSKNATTNVTTFGINANFKGALSGGTITTALAVECTINFSMPISFDQSGGGSQTDGDDEIALSCESGQFSCKVGGNELSCAELKALIDEKACG